VFSPYYAGALRRAPAGEVQADDHCSINVALYGAAGHRWAMTERGARHVLRRRQEFVVGPSRLHWADGALMIDIDEREAPWPRRLRGRVCVRPSALSTYVTSLDDAGRHRWGPIGPCSRIDVQFERPQLRWSGNSYLDSNEGDEPICRPFETWDWSRAMLADGSTAVVYDVRLRGGRERVIAERFAPDGTVSPFEPPPRQALPRTLWRLDRTMRTEPGVPARVEHTLEDTPFYVRSVLRSGLLGEEVTAMHETLAIPRLVSPVVQRMLPFRMPRRA
jgi:carotenoid 1,2-hydratase